MIYRILFLIVALHNTLFGDWIQYSPKLPVSSLPVTAKNIQSLLDLKKFSKRSCKLAVCAMFYNEAEYLKEWIEFHKLVGAQLFYLFNNNSTDDYLAILQPYIDSGEVVLFDWHHTYERGNTLQFDYIQRNAYNHALLISRGKAKWLAFIDIDEFLFPVQKNSLLAVLKSYDKYAGLVVNWQMFGTSNIEKIPSDKLLIETLIMQAPKDYHWNTRIKCILKPKYAKKCLGPHHFSYKKKKKAVNSDKVPVPGEYSDYVVVDKIRINHYYTRDEDHFFNEKVPRRQKLYGYYNYESWFDNFNYEINGEILRFVPQLRKNLGLDN